jgi:hypothetical protein
MHAQQVVVWLAAGKTYELLAGNPQATMPDYDLTHFRDSLPDVISIIPTGPLQPVRRMPVATTTPAPSPFNWMWAAIVGAVMIMSLFTWRLLKDVGKNAGGK